MFVSARQRTMCMSRIVYIPEQHGIGLPRHAVKDPSAIHCVVQIGGPPAGRQFPNRIKEKN